MGVKKNQKKQRVEQIRKSASDLAQKMKRKIFFAHALESQKARGGGARSPWKEPPT